MNLRPYYKSESGVTCRCGRCRLCRKRARGKVSRDAKKELGKKLHASKTIQEWVEILEAARKRREGGYGKRKT